MKPEPIKIGCCTLRVAEVGTYCIISAASGVLVSPAEAREAAQWFGEFVDWADEPDGPTVGKWKCQACEHITEETTHPVTVCGYCNCRELAKLDEPPLTSAQVDRGAG